MLFIELRDTLNDSKKKKSNYNVLLWHKDAGGQQRCEQVKVLDVQVYFRLWMIYYKECSSNTQKCVCVFFL